MPFFMWIGENIATILIVLALVLVVAGIIFTLVRDHKRGKSSCGCGCAGCAMKDTCHASKKDRS